MNDTDRPSTLREVAQLASLRHGGKGGRALARAAEQLGLKATHTTLDNLLQGRYSSRPSDETLRVLSKLSGVGETEVFRIADRPAPLGPLVDDLPDGADALSSAQREAVVAVVRQFVVANEALHGGREEVMGNAEHPAPTKDAGTMADPAAGSGGFLKSALDDQRYREVVLELYATGGGDLDDEERRIYFANLDPASVAAAFEAVVDHRRASGRVTATSISEAAIRATEIEVDTIGALRIVEGTIPGPYDEDLDALPSEDEDAAPIRGGRELDVAARKKGDKP